VDEFAPNGPADSRERLFQPLPGRRNQGGAHRQNVVVYPLSHCASYLRRVYTGSEIDSVEEGDGELRAYEFKLQRRSTRAPHSFLQAYPDATFRTVDMENWLEFVR